MSHVVLLGDSIFDNRAYVAPAPDVVRQLRDVLGSGWRATLLAVDGDVTSDVPSQLRRLPADATHLVISVGGNDALGSAGLLNQRAASVAEAVDRLAEAQGRFRSAYARMLEAVLARRLPTAVCTVYDANYPEPERRVVVAGLALFNDVITRAAFTHGLPLVDLRLICTEPADYANPIEPSEQGGEKIARVIGALVRHWPEGPPQSSIWGN
ncbi:SGNH/GDSL hydrolase family protein [Phenylobacterium sp.]|jgi:hypothetical protein|uniref:SGNH/GDSL hydrolase family protein n=1 Tax=Phenylobacterium sp. TaxID=1871053 RepID=UPI002F959BD6